MADTPDCFQHEQCLVPPAGWTCSRPAGHDGPCAARPVDSNVIPLRVVPTAAQDIPAALERLAARIRAGELGTVDAVGVAVMADDGVHAYGLGKDGDRAMVCLMFQNIINASARGLDPC